MRLKLGTKAFIWEGEDRRLDLTHQMKVFVGRCVWMWKLCEKHQCVYVSQSLQWTEEEEFPLSDAVLTKKVKKTEARRALPPSSFRRGNPVLKSKFGPDVFRLSERRQRCWCVELLNISATQTERHPSRTKRQILSLRGVVLQWLLTSTKSVCSQQLRCKTEVFVCVETRRLF